MTCVCLLTQLRAIVFFLRARVVAILNYSMRESLVHLCCRYMGPLCGAVIRYHLCSTQLKEGSGCSRIIALLSSGWKSPWWITHKENFLQTDVTHILRDVYFRLLGRDTQNTAREENSNIFDFCLQKINCQSILHRKLCTYNLRNKLKQNRILPTLKFKQIVNVIFSTWLLKYPKITWEIQVSYTNLSKTSWNLGWGPKCKYSNAQ